MTTYTLRKKSAPYLPCGCHVVKDIPRPPLFGSPDCEYEIIEYWFKAQQSPKFHNLGYDVFQLVDFDVCHGHNVNKIRDCEHKNKPEYLPVYVASAKQYGVIKHGGGIVQPVWRYERLFDRFACNACGLTC